jgi:hypothetical protein
MSGTVPRSQRRVAAQRGGVVQIASPAGDMSGIGRSMQGLAEVVTGTGFGLLDQERQRQEQRDVFAADESARTAPIRDETGSYVVEQRDPLSRSGRVFNAGVAKRVADDLVNNASVDAVKLRGETENDPQKFAAMWAGRTQGIMSQVPAWLKTEAQASLDRLGAEHVRGAANERITTERRNQAQTWDVRSKAIQADLQGLAASGINSGPEWDDAQRRWSAHLNDGVTTMQVAPAVADALRTQVQDETTGALTVRRTQEMVASGKSRTEVLAHFDEEADKQRMPQAQRNRLRNLVEGSLAEQAQIRNEGRTELHGQVDDWQTRIAGGATVSADEAVRLAADADRLQLPRLAQQVRDTAALQADARVYATMPTAELARQAQTNAGKLLQEGASARDVKLSELTSQMLRARRTAMDADPLAAGATVYRATVGPLVPLDPSNIGAMPEVLRGRERQARQIGAREGRPVSALTKPEAEGLKEMLERGTGEQQQQILTALTAGLTPSTMAATLDILTKGDATSPRTQAFVVAAARSGSNPRQATEILRGMETMRQLKPAAVEGGDWSRVLLEEMGPVLGGRADTMAQVGEAARAIYTQRFATGDRPEDLARKLDPSKFREILREVMPTVTLPGGIFSSGQRIPVPRPGMSQSDFEAEWQRMPASALTGARAADGRPITPDMVRRQGRLVPVGEGTYEVRINGMEVLGEGGRSFRLDMRQPFQPDPPPQQTGDAGSGPRGLRNNNPLNLSFAGQEGAVMETHSNPRFARFASMEDGVAASVRQLARYQERGVSTLAAMVNRWAPPTENDTAAYVQKVARETGIAPDAVVNMRDPELVASLVASMAKVETGRSIDPDVIRRGVQKGIG